MKYNAGRVCVGKDFCGSLAQYPDTYGSIIDWSAVVERCQEHDVLTVACTDLMASVLIKPAGELGFNIAVGSAQRFGVPMVRFMSFCMYMPFSLCCVTLLWCFTYLSTPTVLLYSVLYPCTDE